MSATLFFKAPVSLLVKLWKRCTGCSLVKYKQQVILLLIKESVALRASHYIFSDEEFQDEQGPLFFCLRKQEFLWKECR